MNDEEAYANDILRSVHYDAFGEKVLPTSPIRFESMGDPVLRKSRPIGYDTARIMEAYGYTPDEIGKMDGTSVLCYGGEEMPESCSFLVTGRARRGINALLQKQTAQI